MFKKAATELLVLKKDDFAKVLQASMQKRWDEVQEALTHFPYFSGWTELVRRECCLVSEIMNYKHLEVILGENVGKRTSAHFVLNGSCRMLQKLILRKKGGKYELHPNQESDNKDDGNEAQGVYLQLCLFTKGGSFGLGENLQGRLIVAASNVKLLRIPMYLLRQQNVANIWLRIKQFLDSRIPTNQELLERFIEEKEWIKYRRRLCDSLLRKQIPNNTTIHDTPYYWRVKKMDLDEVGNEKRKKNTKSRQPTEPSKQSTPSSTGTREMPSDQVSLNQGTMSEKGSAVAVTEHAIQRSGSDTVTLPGSPFDNDSGSDSVTL